MLVRYGFRTIFPLDVETQSIPVSVRGACAYFEVTIVEEAVLSTTEVRPLAKSAFIEPIFNQLLPWADQWPSSVAHCESPVSQYLGALATGLGRQEEAEEFFAHAMSERDRTNAKLFATRTNLLWGVMLSRRNRDGDPERARELLERALELASSKSYASVALRARAALGGTGPPCGILDF